MALLSHLQEDNQLISKEELEEYSKLWVAHGGPMLYAPQYDYNADADIYQHRLDKNDWHHGKDVRRLIELAGKLKHKKSNKS